MTGTTAWLLFSIYTVLDPSQETMPPTVGRSSYLNNVIKITPQGMLEVPLLGDPRVYQADATNHHTGYGAINMGAAAPTTAVADTQSQASLFLG